jgi:hypothetical protein
MKIRRRDFGQNMSLPFSYSSCRPASAMCWQRAKLSLMSKPFKIYDLYTLLSLKLEWPSVNTRTKELQAVTIPYRSNGIIHIIEISVVILWFYALVNGPSYSGLKIFTIFTAADSWVIWETQVGIWTGIFHPIFNFYSLKLGRFMGICSKHVIALLLMPYVHVHMYISHSQWPIRPWCPVSHNK